MSFRRSFVSALMLCALAGLSCGVARGQSSLPAQPAGDKPAPGVAERRHDSVGKMVIRIDIQSEKQRRVMTSLELEPYNCRAPLYGPTDYLVDGSMLPVLTEAGLSYVVLVPDMEALIDAEWAHIQASNQQRGLSWFADYKDFAQIRTYTDGLTAARPDLSTNFVAGQSLEGRDIFGVRITSGVGSNKPGILIHGLQHSREWVTGMTAVYIADRLVRTYDTDPVVQSLLDTYEFYIVPCMNPDGYVHTWTPGNRLWRKNRRNNGDGSFGVDLNRNWGYQWGPLPTGGSSGSPNNDTYRGPSAFSEPETVVMSNLVSSNPNMLVHVDVHSYSQLVLSAWGYTDAPAPDAGLFDVVNQEIVDAIFATHGMTYVGGPTFTTIYPANGTSTDWAYGARNVLGWGVECRDTGQTGFVLPAAQILPNAQEIWAGFERAAQWLRDNGLFFGFPGGTPVTTPVDIATTIQIEVGRARQFPLAGSARIFTRVGTSGAFTESTLTPVLGNLYETTLPAGPCGATIQFYLEAQTVGGVTVTYPPAGASGPISVAVTNVVPVFTDDVEAARGWTLGVAGDTASSGQWVRGDPIGTAAQPGDDHTPGAGVNCFFTGQGTSGGGVGQADVDNGFTTLLSPRLDLSQSSGAVISYWRWYSNTEGGAPNADTFRVDISSNDGGTWVNAETVGPTGPEADGGWYYHEIDVESFIAPTANVRVRFVADDSGTGSVVEAAVDDFAVTAISACDPACAADWNADDNVNSQDFFDFLADFFSNDADFNQSGTTDSQDFFDFVAAFFTPC